LETGGLGYKINISPDTFVKLGKIGDDSFLWTHLQVREDAQDLYGFINREELEFFEMLIGVSGIGPKGALAILGVTGTNILRKAIGSGDISYLTKISGIGKKTAEKIVLELRDKMGEEKSDNTLRHELDALEALKSLGYSQNEAREALKKVSVDASLNVKIKEALQILGGK
jgi:Holliday junction DNA helicase RuvA